MEAFITNYQNLNHLGTFRWLPMRPKPSHLLIINLHILILQAYNNNKAKNKTINNNIHNDNGRLGSPLNFRRNNTDSRSTSWRIPFSTTF